MTRDLYIALRLRQLLSGHERTWVVLEGTQLPTDAFSVRTGSRARTVFIRLETYVGQVRTKRVTAETKGVIRAARDSALRVELFIGYNGTLRSVKINDMRLTAERGWFVYRIKKIMLGLLEEVDEIGDWVGSEDQYQPEDIRIGRIRSVFISKDRVVSYIRGKGKYERTERVAKRGMSGKIHVSEPSSAKHSAYPGW